MRSKNRTNKPSSSGLLRSEPAVTNNWAHSKFPFSRAILSGVLPELFLDSTNLIGELNKRSNNGTLPLLAAIWNAVFFLSSLLFTSAPAFFI